MANIRQRFTARGDGNFNAAQVNPRDFLETVKKSFCNLSDGSDEVFFPECQSTNRVVLLGADDIKLDAKCRTTRHPADGVVVNQLYTAGVVFNADAPVVRIFEQGKTRFAVLRAAFRCLMPATDSRGKRGRSIIQVAFEDFKFDPQGVHVWAGMGIGPCCYGADHWPETNDSTVDIPIGKATRGPRAGKRSVDLFEMIRKQLLKIGVKQTNIQISPECTCCKGYFLGPPYFSNCRNGPNTPYQAVGFWMT